MSESAGGPTKKDFTGEPSPWYGFSRHEPSETVGADAFVSVAAVPECDVKLPAVAFAEETTSAQVSRGA